MNEQQYKKFVAACKQNFSLPQKERYSLRRKSVLKFWNELGQEMGFDGTTTKPILGKNRYYFSAEKIEV